MVENRPHIAFFSQTGSEIANIAKATGEWPDLIVTNKRPDNLRKIDKRIEGKVVTVSNRPTTQELQAILGNYDNPIITLHGWLRIMPESICKEYNIFNGHPGLITEYPELKGKDPQIRAFKAKLPVMGCVIHKVTAGVDEGKVLAEERFNAFGISEQEMWDTMKDRSLYLWVNFLKELKD